MKKENFVKPLIDIVNVCDDIITTSSGASLNDELNSFQDGNGENFGK